MPPGGHDVKGFISKWLENSIGGRPVSSWLLPDPTNSTKAKCLVCSCSFSIKEGWTAITSHEKALKHSKNFKATQEDPNHNLFDIKPKQMDIRVATENQFRKTQLDRDRRSQIMRSQLMFSNACHSHGIPSEIFNCMSVLFPKMFPDSKIAQEGWGGEAGHG